jgi:hypothetical protein
MWKSILLVIGAGGVLLILAQRWSNPAAGYPSVLSDFSSHFAIIESLRHGQFFLELNQKFTSEHSISRFLPIYHGLLGSHILALAISQFTGTTTRAMLVLTDSLFLVGLFCLLSWMARLQISYRARALILFCFCYNFILLTEFGAFAQATGLIFGLLGAMLPARFPYLRLMLVALSAWCYPEVLILILPVVAFWSKSAKWQRWTALMVYLILMAVLISRFPLPGGIVQDFTAQLPYFVFIPLIAWHWSRKKKNFELTEVALFAFAISTFTLLGISWIWLGKFSYYSQKLLYWAPLFLGLLLARLQNKIFESLLVLIVFLNIVWDWQGVENEFHQYFQHTTLLSHELEREARDIVTQGECLDGIFLVDTHFTTREKSLALTIALSSLSGRYIVNEGAFDLTGFLTPNSKPVKFDDYNKLNAELLGKSGVQLQNSHNGKIAYFCPTAAAL